MKIITLSEEFYNAHMNCNEILQKKDRPYACLEVTIEGTRFAIPFRHHIHHSYSYLRQDVPRNARLVQYSALQYFEEKLV